MVFAMNKLRVDNKQSYPLLSNTANIQNFQDSIGNGPGNRGSGAWGWRTLGMANPGDGGPWGWPTLGMAAPGDGQPWGWRTGTVYTPSYNSLKKAFEENYYKAKELKWKDASALWHEKQGSSESVSQYIV
jgi:hypothetical protein